MELVDVPTCLCCSACAHEVTEQGQFKPCNECGQTVTHSALPRGEQAKVPRTMSKKGRQKPKA